MAVIYESEQDVTYDDVLNYTDLPPEAFEQRPMTLEEKRDYLLGQVALNYVKCVETHEHGTRAWNMLSKWLHQLVEVQEELWQR